MAQLEADPEGISVPTSPSTLYALVGFIGSHATVKNLDQVGKFILRLPMEFQVVVFRDLNRRNPDVTRHPVFQKWALVNHRELF